MIKVKVQKRSARKFWEYVYLDPDTGKEVVKTTKCKTRRDAERFAARKEDQLNNGGELLHLTWAEFDIRYTEEVLEGQRPKSQKKMRAVFNVFKRLSKPNMMMGITASTISKYKGKLRRRGRSEATIKSHLTCLRAALSWAEEVGIIRKVPKIKMPTKTDSMKGRPISDDEFEKMLAKADKVYGPRADQYRHDLRGCYLSSLRLEEAYDLDWTDYRKLCIDLTGEFPMFKIQVISDKGKEFRMLPMAPDFAKWLLKIPVEERKGRVFKFPVLEPGGGDPRVGCAWLGKTVRLLGKLAGIDVATKQVRIKRETVTRTKYASFHDFRRSFGFRWAGCVLPKYLQELMRHVSIRTTMEFYVGKNAEDTARVVWSLCDPVTGKPRDGKISEEQRALLGKLADMINRQFDRHDADTLLSLFPSLSSSSFITAT